MWESLIPVALLLSPGAAHDQANGLLTGTFSNEEQVYFDNQAKRPAAKRLSLRVTRHGDVLTIEEIDSFGVASPNRRTATVRNEGNLVVLDYGKCQQQFRSTDIGLLAAETRVGCNSAATITAITPFAMTMDIAGQTTELRRSRPVICWVAILKEKPKADGTEDWYFQRDVLLHDQGGRAQAGGGDTGAPELVIRVRNVTWDKGSANKPAVTLYVHKPEKPDRAEAYSWAAPESSRVGINLRWMQAGCTLQD
jgi:hypothetical protein